MKIPTTEELRESLRAFLEVHCKAKILAAEPGALTMYIRHAKNTAKKPKDKMIAYLLLRIEERLLDERAPDEKARVVCEFLISEARAYYKELH